jgi:hypothetical protein
VIVLTAGNPSINTRPAGMRRAVAAFD